MKGGSSNNKQTNKKNSMYTSISRKISNASNPVVKASHQYTNKKTKKSIKKRNKKKRLISINNHFPETVAKKQRVMTLFCPPSNHSGPLSTLNKQRVQFYLEVTKVVQYKCNVDTCRPRVNITFNVSMLHSSKAKI